MGIAVFVSAGLACSSTNGGNGALDVTWTVNGTKDAALCDQNTGWVSVQVSYGGTIWASNNAPCHAFHIAFSNVASGDYSVNATLFNAGTNDTLGSSSPHGVTVTAGQTTTDALAFTVPSN